MFLFFFILKGGQFKITCRYCSSRVQSFICPGTIIITIVLRHVFLTIAIALSKYSVQLVGKEGWYSGIKLGRGAGDNSNDSNKIFDTKENVSFMNSNIHCSFVRNNSHVFL